MLLFRSKSPIVETLMYSAVQENYYQELNSTNRQIDKVFFLGDF